MPSAANSDLDRNTLLGIAACSVFAVGWNASVTGAFEARLLLFAPALCFVCHCAGVSFLYVTRSADALGGDFLVSLLVGSLLAGGFLMGAQFLLPFGIGVNSALFGAAALGTRLTLLRSMRRQPSRFGTSGEALVLLLALLLGTTFWCQDTLRPFVETESGVRFIPWRDAFFHASQIASFRNPDAAFRLSLPWFAGIPATFYHYASYQLASSYSLFTNSSALNALCAFLVPYGTLLSGLGAYLLGTSLWGRGAGAAAALAVCLLPDASTLGLGHSWLSYHWLQQIAPGGPYASAVSALALACTLAGCRDARAGLVVLGLFFSGLCLLFRAHLFLILLPVVALWTPLFGRRFSLRSRGLVAAAWLMVAALALVLQHELSLSPGLGFDPEWATRSYARRLVLETLEASWLREPLMAITETPSLARDLPIGALLLWSCSFGALGVLYPALLLLLWRRGRLAPQDALPALAIGVHLMIALTFAPNRWGNSEEMHHRPFVLAYFLLAAWCGARSFSLLQGWRARVLGQPVHRALLVAAFPLLLVPLWFGAGVTSSKLSWAVDYYDLEFPRGLMLSTEFIRNTSHPRDLIQDSERDPITLTAGMTDRRSYLGWARWLERGGLHDEVIERERRLAELKTAETLDELTALAQQTRIRWYLMHPGDAVGWPAEFLARPAFASGDFRVYQLPSGGRSR